MGDSALMKNQVDQLSAMVSKSVPSGADNVIPQDIKGELQHVLVDKGTGQTQGL